MLPMIAARWTVSVALLAVLVAGALRAWSGLTVPAAVQQWAELGVGLLLIGVGLWAWHNARRLHIHDPRRHGGHGHLHAHDGTGANHEHAHPHDHDHHADTDRRHTHLSTVVGAVHGLSGTAPVVALIPVTLMPSFGAAVGYLLAFGIGTTAGMGAYAALAALAVSRAGASLKLARTVAFGTAAASVAVGLWWLWESAAGTGG